MRIFTWSSLRRLSERHPQAQRQLAQWREMIRAASWTNSQELRRTAKFNPSIITNTRVVFDIKGNDYRLICDVRYAEPERGSTGAVFIKFFGTHSEYDAVDPATVEEF